jgi:hypothetical protein
MMVQDWIASEYPRPPDVLEQPAGIQHPFHHERALAALERFEQLPKAEKLAIRHRLGQALISMDQWLATLAQSDSGILCLGERHTEATRRFLAGAFFTRYRADVLMLEATPKKLTRLLSRMEAGRAYFPLLEADIMAVMRAARARNAAIEIVGIEETRDQEEGRASRSGSRDQALAHNFWQHYRPGKGHVVLFGALHCADEPHWLFGNLKAEAPEPLQARMRNARVVGEHQNGPVEAFVFFLDEIGLAPGSFAIADSGALPAHIATWFPLLKDRILDKFQVLIVFRR